MVSLSVCFSPSRFHFMAAVPIADLQERMMNVEASRYDDQLNNIEWAATLALEQNKEQQKDIYSLQKASADYQFRIMEMEWDVYDKR